MYSIIMESRYIFSKKVETLDQIFRDRIAEKINEIGGLTALGPCSPQFNSWRKATEGLIMNAFGEGAELEDFNAIFYTPLFLSCRMKDAVFKEAYIKGLDEARLLLGKLLQR